jgi:hypothetical protein
VKRLVACQPRPRKMSITGPARLCQSRNCRDKEESAGKGSADGTSYREGFMALTLMPRDPWRHLQVAYVGSAAVTQSASSPLPSVLRMNWASSLSVVPQPESPIVRRTIPHRAAVDVTADLAPSAS